MPLCDCFNAQFVAFIFVNGLCIAALFCSFASNSVCFVKLFRAHFILICVGIFVGIHCCAKRSRGHLFTCVSLFCFYCLPFFFVVFRLFFVCMNLDSFVSSTVAGRLTHNTTLCFVMMVQAFNSNSAWLLLLLLLLSG